MDLPDALLARIRALTALRFESPGRGALCVARLGRGLPPSEQLAGVDDAQRALDAIRRTLQQAHRHQHWFDQHGAGRYFELERDVTEGGRRWTFVVLVLARPNGALVIEDANVVRPEDREDVELTETIS